MGKDFFEARTYVRDSDGGRRKVRRTGRSEEDARREPQRHLKIRTAPITGQLVTDKTTLAELFDAWIAAKIAEGDIAPQTEHGYRTVWQVHAQEQIGPLRIREFPTIRVREVPQAPSLPPLMDTGGPREQRPLPQASVELSSVCETRLWT